jgi:methionine synthase II (cobalamin-independent)
VGSTYTDSFDYLKSLVPESKHKDLKLTLAAPNWYHLRYKKGKAYPEEVYQNEDDYFADIAAAYQAELKILYEHGARNIQFDDPNLACKSARPPRSTLLGVSPDWHSFAHLAQISALRR